MDFSAASFVPIASSTWSGANALKEKGRTGAAVTTLFSSSAGQLQVIVRELVGQFAVALANALGVWTCTKAAGNEGKEIRLHAVGGSVETHPVNKDGV